MNTNSLVNTTFFKKGDTIKGGHYSRGDIIQGRTLFQEIRYVFDKVVFKNHHHVISVTKINCLPCIDRNGNQNKQHAPKLSKSEISKMIFEHTGQFY